MKCRSQTATVCFWTTPRGRAHDERTPPPREEVCAMGLAPAVPLAFAVDSLLREPAELRHAMKRALPEHLSASQIAGWTRQLDRHCQRGNDLVYEAYIVDLGGEN